MTRIFQLADRVNNGRVPERPNGTVSKTVVGASSPGVQIPPLPPLNLLCRFAEAFQGVSDGVPKYLQSIFNGIDTRDFVAIKRGDLYFGDSLA